VHELDPWIPAHAHAASVEGLDIVADREWVDAGNTNVSGCAVEVVAGGAALEAIAGK
jgi:hypothetical protein